MRCMRLSSNNTAALAVLLLVTELPGSSSTIVVGDRVFVTCWTGYGVTQGKSMLRRELICLDRANSL